MDVVLYTRRGCHLCEEAEDVVEAWLPDARLVDVAGDVALERAWGARVPVLAVDGRVVAEGRVVEGDLVAAIARGFTGRG